MSSVYRILCVSHDPALVLKPEYQSGRDGRTLAAHAAAHPDEYEELAAHANCDLLVGRYSYPLVEVGCPAPPKDKTPSHYPYHPHACKWVDAKWLRLLLHAKQQDGETPLGKAAADVDGCWSASRLDRLRHELL